MIKNTRSPISQRLKEARLEAGLSQKELGVQAGIDQFSASARMNQYESEKHVPDFGTVKRISEVLGIPPAYFYCDDTDLADVIKNWLKVPKKHRIQMHNIMHAQKLG